MNATNSDMICIECKKKASLDGALVREFNEQTKQYVDLGSICVDCYNKLIRKKKMSSQPGLPKDLEDEVMNALIPIISKYKEMKKSHLNSARIAGISYVGLRKACLKTLWNKKRKGK